MTRLLLAALLFAPCIAWAPGSRPVIPDGWGTPWRPPVAESGIASWYGAWHHGRLTSSGEPFDMHAMTAASRTLPMGSVVEVVCEATGRAVVVEITDRGPYIAGRVLDLSYAAAVALGMVSAGVADVRIYKSKEVAP